MNNKITPLKLYNLIYGESLKITDTIKKNTKLEGFVDGFSGVPPDKKTKDFGYEKAYNKGRKQRVILENSEDKLY